MASPARSRRLRAIAAAESLGVVEGLLETLVGALRDEDHMVRAQAARVLGGSSSPEVVRALRRAEQDKSPSVRQAATDSLERIAELGDDAVAMTTVRHLGVPRVAND
jgi:HEAT repeat protein